MESEECVFKCACLLYSMFRMTTTSDGEGEGSPLQCICLLVRLLPVVALPCRGVGPVGTGWTRPWEREGFLSKQGGRGTGGCDVMELENRNKNNDDRRGTGTTT